MGSKQRLDANYSFLYYAKCHGIHRALKTEIIVLMHPPKKTVVLKEYQD